MARILKLAQLDEPEAISMLEEYSKNEKPIEDKSVEKLHKRSLSEYFSGFFPSILIRHEIGTIENMEIGEEYTFEELARMFKSMKDYRNKIILFYLSFVGFIIVISAVITLILFFYKK